MTENKEEYFKKMLKGADELYENGEWRRSVDIANVAVDTAREIGNEEYSANALNRRGWGERYVGFKSDNPEERKVMYEAARKDWKVTLEKSKNLRTRISAIKGLILLPGKDVKKLCNIGIQEIQNSHLDAQEKENIKAELENSREIETRKTDPQKAEKGFLKSYETVQHGTVIAGHLLQNAGTCCLMLLKDAKDAYDKYYLARRAILLLEKALEEYPADQIEHRKSTQNKINNTKKDLAQYEKEYKEEKDKLERERQLNDIGDAEGPSSYSGKPYREV